jgi:small neutral amino acid transporter SnatA (MarC family)
MKKAISVVVLLVGAFFAFLPHSVHQSFGLQSPHPVHVTSGIILLIIGVWLWMSSGKTPTAK